MVAEEAEVVETDAGRAARSYDEQPWVIEDDNEARSAYGWFVPPPEIAAVLESATQHRLNRRRHRRTREPRTHPPPRRRSPPHPRWPQRLT